MNWVDKLPARAWSILVIGMLAFAISGCEGDTGPAGLDGLDGQDGQDGVDAPVPDGIDEAIANADAESCGTCHGETGDLHQAEYDKYGDASNLDLEILSVISTFDEGTSTYDAAMMIHVERNGLPVTGMTSWISRGRVVWGPSGMSQMSFYTVHYENTGRVSFDNKSFSMDADADQGLGNYLLTATGSTFDPEPSNGQAYGYLVADPLDTEGMTLYDNVVNAAVPYGNVDTYQSLANSSGCENCHGRPYMKHGYREANVLGLPDFAACKSCHYDDRSGHHEDWQYMVDDPLNWANDVAIPDDGRYEYNATVLNDTHMSHAMEFPYPQSMSNCVTCHEDNLALITADTYFDLQFCKSCHVIEGVDAWPELDDGTPEELYAQPHRPPPMTYLWANSTVPTLHSVDMTCTLCHGTDGFSSFSDMHSGYDDHIYDSSGNQYAYIDTVVISSVTMNGDLMTIEFSSGSPDLVPEVLVSFYGGDTKNFIVGSHERDANAAACPGSHGDGCQMEYVPESAGGDPNPLFTEEAGSGYPNWVVTLDLAAFQAVKTDPIPTMIADGRIKMAEISITPELVVDGVDVVLRAATETFDLSTTTIVDEYFQGDNATVDVDKCNNCHVLLASTFHDASGRGGDEIVVCKNCHTTTFPGSHIELASRGIDSYVHAIHTFQPFDEDDVYNYNKFGADNDPDFDNGTVDPVFVARNEQHKKHIFPNFTALSCEGCHMDGTYNAADQSKSMFGVQQSTWAIADRNIGTIPESVTGPSSRACGGCHRADMVIRDAAGELASFDAHTDAFGTFEANDDEDEILYGIIGKIMSMFE